MPVSKFFNNAKDKADQKLYNDLVNEVVYISGVDANYMVRESGSSVDLLFGEDPTSKFTTAYPLAVLVQSVDNFEGGEIFSKFGLEVRKQVRFFVTQNMFLDSVAKNNPNNYLGSPNVYGSSDILSRPREGDLVWLDNFKALFEIKYVDEEFIFYSFGNIYGYSLTCEKFRYSNENVNTGIEDIDDTVDNVVAAYAFTMANTYGSFTYQQDETVYQGGANLASATATANIVSWNLPTLTLTLKNIQGNFLVNSAIVGANSNAIFNLVSYNMLEQVNPNIDNNNDLAVEGENILNFDDLNPFGNPSE